ncbi:hypothetical protein SAMN04489712_117129 [Thermomonospora echinospora]|uniref:Phenylacetate-coenzyme A ligase PaaK, adenylate-forming domain family n=1 Tax=Thermomonospora echinospora TaxID=1992 RepID=A0A1H6DIH8_9ACTN|nr:hypothetical protein [Thermomonospora echinospora]SEG85068.1 hypothetical protein SAMN04489712_117129 [Thermomonospora echinospora]
MSAVTGHHPVIEAIDARFQERRRQVPVLAQRADAEGITAIRAREDMVPLLFPHTTYKSYPESLVAKGRWAQLNRWLDSLSAHRVTGVDVTGVEDVDDWIDRLEAAGHLVSSSSGTSGKNSFLNKTRRDRDVSLRNLIDCLTEIGLPPEPVWHVVPVGPTTGVTAHTFIRDAIKDAYGRPDGIEIFEKAAPDKYHRYMARLNAMRRAMADGTARPDEVAAFEAEAARRQAEMEERAQHIADQVIAHRSERIFFHATFPMLYRLSELVRGRGVSEGFFTGENATTTGGGLKGDTLPPDYQDRIFGLFNITPSRFLHYYSMQELNVRMPKCPQGRYHVPPQLVLFVLDQAGETLAPVSDGQIEGRAAFFDLTVDGRWGGTITGDRIRVELGTCPCGRPGPTVFDEIVRYSDLADDDKITCAGTMEGYVRGFLQD